MLAINKKAKRDIIEIYKYSVINFGEHKADEYYLGLCERMENLANGFVMSTDYSFIKKGLRRANYEGHSIYYRTIEDENKVIILRVLGKYMEAIRHI